MDDGMIERRLAVVEKRVDEYDLKHAQDRLDIEMLKKMHVTQQETLHGVVELISYAKKTYEVFEPLAKVITIVAKIGAVTTIAWHGAKLIYAKLMLVNL